MLPALLLPGGTTLCLCWCPEMRAPVAEHSCCGESVSTQGADDLDETRLVAPCAGCHPVEVPHDQVRQTEVARVDVLVPPSTLVASVLGFVVPPARAHNNLRWSGARAPSPPGLRRALPLLI